VTEDEWRALGKDLATRRGQIDVASSRLMWQLGDWVIAGEDGPLSRLKKTRIRALAAEVSGYARHTLSQAVYVARRVPTSIRMESLSWAHHQQVARLDTSDQYEWLSRAVECGLSVHALRAELQESGVIRRAHDANPTSQVIARLVQIRRDQIANEDLAVLMGWLRSELSISLSGVA
jgi:hypothetical protein